MVIREQRERLYCANTLDSECSTKRKQHSTLAACVHLNPVKIFMVTPLVCLAQCVIHFYSIIIITVLPLVSIGSSGGYTQLCYISLSVAYRGHGIGLMSH